MSDTAAKPETLYGQLSDAALRSTIGSLWVFAFALFAIDIVWMSCGGFSVAPVTAVYVAAIALAIFGLGYFYTIHRPVPEFQACVFGIAFILVYTNALALCSYLLTSLALPLHDDLFSHMDIMLGFDWLAWLQWMNEHPSIGNTLTLAYRSSMIQVFCVILFTAFTLRHDRLRAFLALFVMTSSSVILIAGIFPSIGPYAFYGPSPADFSNLNPAAGTWHLEQMTALRDGTLRHIDLRQIEGLVSFPSFHTALAIITAYALRGLRWVFLPAMILNALVILSTLSEGGHYLVDIIGGTAITIVAIVAYEKWSRIVPVLSSPARESHA